MNDVHNVTQLARSEPGQIVPAIKRGIAETKKGKPVLLEFITKKETVVSRYQPEK